MWIPRVTFVHKLGIIVFVFEFCVEMEDAPLSLWIKFRCIWAAGEANKHDYYFYCSVAKVLFRMLYIFPISLREESHMFTQALHSFTVYYFTF